MIDLIALLTIGLAALAGSGLALRGRLPLLATMHAATFVAVLVLL